MVTPQLPQRAAEACLRPGARRAGRRAARRSSSRTPSSSGRSWSRPGSIRPGSSSGRTGFPLRIGERAERAARRGSGSGRRCRSCSTSAAGSFKKGLDLLLEAVAGIPEAHVAIVGPDDGDGTLAPARGAAARPELAGRVHLLPPFDEQPAARALRRGGRLRPALARTRASGWSRPRQRRRERRVVVTDRCGVAELLGERAALVVPPRR